MNFLRHSWYAFLYYLSWLLFGLGGLLLNLVLAPGLLLPDRRRLGPVARGAIRGMFSFWVKWLHACGVVHVYWHGVDKRLPGGRVYVANHPTLIDATLLLARLPDAVCIFKPALLRNPVIGPAALLAGYIAGDQGVDTIRIAAEHVAAGQALLIFPEGTRTAPGSKLNPLKPGFGLIARRANAPVQVMHIRSSPMLTTRGRKWWKLPPLPGRVDVYGGKQLPADSGVGTAELTQQVDALLRAGPDS